MLNWRVPAPAPVATVAAFRIPPGAARSVDFAPMFSVPTPVESVPRVAVPDPPTTVTEPLLAMVIVPVPPLPMEREKVLVQVLPAPSTVIAPMSPLW